MLVQVNVPVSHSLRSHTSTNRSGAATIWDKTSHLGIFFPCHPGWERKFANYRFLRQGIDPARGPEYSNLNVTDSTTPHAPPQSTNLQSEIDAALSELASTIDPVPSACFVIREDTSLAYVSQDACQSLGYESAELLTLSILDLDVNLSREIWNRVWAISSPPDTTTFPTIHRRKNGSESPVTVRAVRVLIGGEDVVVSYTVARTLTE